MLSIVAGLPVSPAAQGNLSDSVQAGSKAGNTSASQSETLADLPVTEQVAISTAIGQDQSAYHVTSGASGATLANAANGFTAQLQSGVLQVAAGSDNWETSLVGLGYGGAVQPVGTAQTSVDGNRVDENYGAVDEWYVNGPSGLEQGFDVTPSAQAEASGSLTVALSLSGDLVGAVNAAGTGLTLTRPDGSTALDYTGLTAYDSTGKALPASLAVQAVGGRQELLIHVNARGAQGQITIDPFLQSAEITASDGEADNVFGCAVAISGNTVVVGASDFGASGIGPGAAYVFTEPATGWASMTETAKLTPSDSAVRDQFGISVAISGDTVVVGSLGAPTLSPVDDSAVYVFTEPATGWTDMTQTAKLTFPDSSDFGASVAISGNTVVVGDSNVGLPRSGLGLCIHGACRRMGRHEPACRTYGIRCGGRRWIGLFGRN